MTTCTLNQIPHSCPRNQKWSDGINSILLTLTQIKHTKSDKSIKNDDLSQKKSEIYKNSWPEIAKIIPNRRKTDFSVLKS